MKNTSPRLSFLNNTPLPVRLFLQRAFVLFICWKLLYHLLLVPIQFPDKPLTRLTAYSTGFLYQVFFKESVIDYRETLSKGSKISVIYVQGKRVLAIADGCNGLELYVLYLGFLMCIPTTNRRLMIFALVGIIGIYVLNTFRCFGLVWLFLHNYKFADFAHHYLFKMVIYAMIFYAWVKYSSKYFTYG